MCLPASNHWTQKKWNSVKFIQRNILATWIVLETLQEILPGKSICLTYLLAIQICLPDTNNQSIGVLAPWEPHAKHGGAAYYTVPEVSELKWVACSIADAVTLKLVKRAKIHLSIFYETLSKIYEVVDYEGV